MTEDATRPVNFCSFLSKPGIDSTDSLWAADSKEKIPVNDPILDELWHVREQLVKQHGGLDGFFAYIRKLDRNYRRLKSARVKKRTLKHPTDSQSDK